MGIRIDHIRHGQENVVYIAGHLSGPAVAQLKETCAPIGGPLVIDLSSLLFADEEGIHSLRSIIDRGAKVHGASPFIAMLLESAADGQQGGRNRNHPVWI